MAMLLVGTILTIAASSLANQPITFEGIGSIRIGDSVKEASRAVGEALEEWNWNRATIDSECIGDCCFHVRLKSSPSMYFMVEDDKIVRLETGDRRYRTLSGVRVGDSESKARAVYRGRLRVTGHQYIPEGHYFIVESADKHHALVMETDGKRVTYIRAGVEPAAEYVERCL